jgi:hypothetical protein
MTIIQQDKTGCGIASVANIVGKSYAAVKARAAAMGIDVNDDTLYSDCDYVCSLLADYGFRFAPKKDFTDWAQLPDLALLAIKHHQFEGKSYWHWVVFKRDKTGIRVLDSAPYLPQNERTDFEAMQPQWYISVSK